MEIIKKKSIKELYNAMIPIMGTASSIEIFKELSLRDLVILWTESMRMLEANDGIPPVSKEISKKWLSDFKDVFYMIAEKVKTLPEVFYLEDEATKMPHFTKEECIPLFATPDQAAEYSLKVSKEGGRVLTKRTDKVILFLRDCFYRNGALGAMIYADAHYVGILSNSFFDEPGLTGVTKETNDTLNPEFVRYLCLFEQELKKKIPNEGNFTLWEMLLKNELKTVKFILPVKISENSTITPVLEGKEGEIGTPVFTDWIQFLAQYDPRKWDGAYFTARELIQYGKRDLFVINFKTNCLTFSKEKLIKMLES